MADSNTTQTVRVQIEGLEDLQALVREMRRAAEEMTRAAKAAQMVTHSTRTADSTARRLCDPEATQ